MTRACAATLRSGLDRVIGSGWKPSGGSEQCPEVCLAGTNHPCHDRRLRHDGDHAPGWRVQALRLALAAALHGGGRRRPAARQDAKAREGADPRPDCGAVDRTDAWRAAWRDDALDQPAMAKVAGLAISTV